MKECIEKLSTQNDKFESEIEQLSATAGKKKKLDKDVNFFLVFRLQKLNKIFSETRKVGRIEKAVGAT